MNLSYSAKGSTNPRSLSSLEFQYSLQNGWLRSSCQHFLSDLRNQKNQITPTSKVPSNGVKNLLHTQIAYKSIHGHSSIKVALINSCVSNPQGLTIKIN